MQKNKRWGYTALLGRSNVGKSTLFNRLLGTHLSAVTHKQQTTRYNIDGILTEQNYQIVFVDTPGLHRARKNSFNRWLNENAQLALNRVDVVLLLVERNVWTPEDEDVLQRIAASNKPCILIMNKCDLVKDKSELLMFIKQTAQRHDFVEIFPVSALRDKEFEALKQGIAKFLPQRPLFHFPEDQLTDRSERFLVAEFIREQAMLNLHRELPYAIHVEIETFEDKGKLLHINAVIFVLKDSQRSIVIGKNGDCIKRIGSRARRQIEAFLNKQVYLQLWVKVAKDWQWTVPVSEMHEHRQ